MDWSANGTQAQIDGGGGTTANCFAAGKASIGGANQTVTITVAEIPPNNVGGGHGVMLYGRNGANDGSKANCYFVFAFGGGGGNFTLYLRKNVAGVQYDLNSLALGVATLSQLSLTCNGDSISATADGQTVSATDTDVATGNYAGFQGYINSTTDAGSYKISAITGVTV